MVTELLLSVPVLTDKTVDPLEDFKATRGGHGERFQGMLADAAPSPETIGDFTRHMTSSTTWLNPITLSTSPTFRRSARGFFPGLSEHTFAGNRRRVWFPFVQRFTHRARTSRCRVTFSLSLPPSVFCIQKVYLWYKVCFFPRSPHGFLYIRATRCQETKQINPIIRVALFADLYVSPSLWFPCAILLSSSPEN